MGETHNISQRVRILRARRHLSQPAFAELMGFSRNIVSGVENGAKASPRFLKQLAQLEGLADVVTEGSIRAESTDQGETPSDDSSSQVDTSFGSDPRGVLKRRRLDLGISREELATRTRFKAAHIADIEEARVRPTEKFLRKVSKVLDLPFDALMAGSDQPPLMGAGVTFGATPRVKLTAGLDARTIPLISMAQAGEMRSYDDIYDYEGVIDYASKGPKTFAVRIRGDSMSPRFPEGTVAVLEPEREIRTEKLVVVKLRDGSVLFKQLQMQGDNFRLISFNPIYEAITVARQDVEWIYRVVRTQETHD